MDSQINAANQSGRVTPEIADLIVPDIVWKLTHRYRGLDGRAVTTPGFTDYTLRVAQQDIEFRLDCNGAELKSEAEIGLAKSCERGVAPLSFYFDRPFLVYMKARDADQPFFVMWIDNAELLCKWTGK